MNDELHCCYLCRHVDIRTDNQQSGRLMVDGMMMGDAK